MLTIATYRNLMAAELAKTRLEFYDIRATVADACSFTLGYGSVIDGVRLQVQDADAERAKEILATGEFVAPPDDSAILAESPEAGIPGPETSRKHTAESVSVWLFFLLGVLSLILGRPAGLFSGPLVLLGTLLIGAALWIAYGRLEGEEGRL